jgi:hypothetical protein
MEEQNNSILHRLQLWKEHLAKTFLDANRDEERNNTLLGWVSKFERTTVHCCPRDSSVTMIQCDSSKLSFSLILIFLRFKIIGKKLHLFLGLSVNPIFFC